MVSDIKCLLHWRFCFESLTFISSFPKKSVRCREISAIKFVLYKEVSLYFDSLKPEILFAVDEIRLKKNTIILKKQQDLNKSAIETTVIELPKLNVIENKKNVSMFWFISLSQQFFWWNQIFKHHHEIICQMELSFPLNTRQLIIQIL